jgi:hypothetical protein
MASCTIGFWKIVSSEMKMGRKRTYLKQVVSLIQLNSKIVLKNYALVQTPVPPKKKKADKNLCSKLDMMLHVCEANTQESEAGELLSLRPTWAIYSEPLSQKKKQNTQKKS